MLTRIEIDGYKSFDNFALDLQPFTVIFGHNATGKSNLFDALRLLSRLASKDDLASAFSDPEGGHQAEPPRGDPMEQFRRTPAGVSRHIRLAAELLLPRHVTDTQGGSADLSQTRIRYEITIERREEQGRERLIVVQEAATPIKKADDRWMPGGQRPSKAFEQAFVERRRQSAFISTEHEGGRAVLNLHQEGRQGRKRPADTVNATVLSSITTIDFPHLYALKGSLRSIHFMHLNPGMLQNPSPLMAQDQLAADGRNLAHVLARIERETRDGTHLRGNLTDIRNAMSSLVSGIRDIHVRYDETERRHRVEFETTDGLAFSARVASDGTLRMLALAAMLYDPKCPDVICFEEPENGVHKSRLVTLIELLRESCTDPASDEQDPGEPLRQIVLNTHSPVVARSLIRYGSSIVLAETVMRTVDGRRERLTKMRTRRTAAQAQLAVPGEDRALGEYDLEELAEAADEYAT